MKTVIKLLKKELNAWEKQHEINLKWAKKIPEGKTFQKDLKEAELHVAELRMAIKLLNDSSAPIRGNEDEKENG